MSMETSASIHTTFVAIHPAGAAVLRRLHRNLLVSINAWNKQGVVLLFVAQLHSCDGAKKLDGIAVCSGVAQGIQDHIKPVWPLIQVVNTGLQAVSTKSVLQSSVVLHQPRAIR